ncbi:MAG: ABC transporter ATP-binding protein [Erysipelothrix sp.]|nr:ABC transporter ATP-binding protein [Erysipelothrix sp.]
MSYIEVKDIQKIYQMGTVEIKAVAGISFTIEQGEFIVILGPSGAGKTTVMNIIGGMDLPTSGSVKIDGKEITSKSDKELTKYRRDDVGFIFQSYNLIPNLTALENVELATHINTDAKDSLETLAMVGVADRAGNFPAQLSGGEQQRVAIARAIAKNPKLLLCDEPTGALDTETGTQVLKVLRDSSDIQGMTVIVITHNAALTAIADRVIVIRDGLVESDEKNKNIIDVEDIEW